MKQVLLHAEQAEVTCPFCTETGKTPSLNGRSKGLLICGKCQERFVILINQRKYFRKNCEISGSVIDRTVSNSIPMTIKDISRTGLRFALPSGKEILKIGREYEVQMVLGRKNIVTRIRILRHYRSEYGGCFVFTQDFSKEESAIVSFLM